MMRFVWWPFALLLLGSLRAAPTEFWEHRGTIVAGAMTRELFTTSADL